MEDEKRTLSFKLFTESFNEELGNPIEIVHEKQKDFKGYYLFFEITYHPKQTFYPLIDEKTFLIGVNDPHRDVIKDCNAAGFVDFRGYMSTRPGIFAKKEALQYSHINNQEPYGYFGYEWISFFEKDNTYRPVVKSILKYLELYDEYLKNK